MRKIIRLADRLPGMRPVRWSVWGPVCLFLGLSLLVLGSTLKPGYVLALDMVYGPQTAHRFIEQYVHGILVNQADTGGSPTIQVFFSVVSRAASSIMPMWLVQKLWLVLLLTCAGVSMYFAVPPRWKPARFYAGLLYVINPYVLVRLLAGHFFILWGVAFFPMVFKYTITMVEKPNYRNAVVLACWLTLLAASVHFLALAIGLITLFVGVRLVRGGDRLWILKSYVVCLAVFILLNLGFFYSMLTSAGHLAATVSQSTSESLQYFSARSSTGSLLFDLVSMYGFWHQDYNYPGLHVFGWRVLLGLIFWFAVVGVYRKIRRPDTRHLHIAMVVMFALCVLLGAGALFSPTADLYLRLNDFVPLLGIFRDSQKLIGFAVLAYAYYGAVGVAYLFGGIRRLEWRRFAPLGKAMLVVPFLIVALYSYKLVPNVEKRLFNGFYPDTYQAAERMLSTRELDTTVVIFPWHGYMPLEWIGYNTANPLQFFSGKVAYGDNVEIGSLYTTSTSPVSRHIEASLGPLFDGTEKNLGEKLEPLRASHVLLLKEVDFRRYRDALDSQEDLSVTMENDDLIIYAVNTSGPPDSSTGGVIPEPARWHYIPWYAFSGIVGLLVALWLWRYARVSNSITVTSETDGPQAST